MNQGRVQHIGRGVYEQGRIISAAVSPEGKYKLESKVARHENFARKEIITRGCDVVDVYCANVLCEHVRTPVEGH